jgi:hypothetical protein
MLFARSLDFLPPPPFFQLLLQTKQLRQSTLGSPLRDAWVALGPRLGHAWATQGPPKPNPKQAEGRKALRYSDP